MAEDFARSRQYEYRANSNLVLQADPEVRARAAREPTGEVETLAGKRMHRMGDKVEHGRPPELNEKIQKMKKRRDQVDSGPLERENKRRKGFNVLTETEDVDAIAYRPKTKQTKATYEQILAFMQDLIGDQPQDILRGAAEEVLVVLKSDIVRDKQTEVEKIVPRMSSDKFNKLVNLSKQITDFSISGRGEDNEDEGKIDEEIGVAVVFDEDDEEEESDLDEIRESEESEDEGGVEAGETSRLKGVDDGDVDMDDAESEFNLKVQQIDAYWLQRELSKYYKDADLSAKYAEEVLEYLGLEDQRECENKLVLLLDTDKFAFIKLLLRNRKKIYYCTRLNQAQTDEERKLIEKEMERDEAGGGPAILEALHKTESAESWMQDRLGTFDEKTRREARALKKMERNVEEEDGLGIPVVADGSGPKPERTLDIDSLVFQQGSHVMTNKQTTLPEGTLRMTKKGYEEVHVPAVKADQTKSGQRRVPIAELPDWTRPAFKGMESLNRMQSRMMDAALFSSENLLLCAPTGAGKTNVAVLTILHELGKARREDGSFRLDSFKIVYVAPMKALVQEVVANFTQRLTEAFGLVVRELSGDVSLSKEEIAETQIIVTTPEKWDIITRKSGERTYTQLVRLIIIDEIHLLHDERGPVLEAIVIRTLRQIETTQEMVRLVGLSATLPNYGDVAAFLRVNSDRGLFFFDNSFRPVPLQQQYIGITEKKAIKRMQLMNEICYDKVLEQGKAGNQVLIFVHSRKETAKTARALKDMALERDEINRFVREDEAATREILREEGEATKNPDLKELLPFGFAIHHAGMARVDRKLVEDLFADGNVKVLVSTATLAWGVNLPAHTVIIKGTQIYNPEKGRWTELSPLDVVQMLGRAGRPQFDSKGEGIIITQHSELQFYTSLMNQQLPVESQLARRLADNINAEIVLGTVQNVREAANWLGYSYLYVRMLAAPHLYGVSVDQVEEDPTLQQRLLDLAHSAAAALAKNNLIKYDRRTGNFQVTDLGRIASHYYIVHSSMATYNDYLRPSMTDIELFRLFALSYEFRTIVVRDEEKLELQKLIDRVPVPIKESIDEPSAKVNLLLQAYISRLKLEGFALVQDMVYIHQSGVRIFRALFELCLRKGWASVADRALNVCKMVDHRMWLSQTPLRQFPKESVSPTILTQLEKKDISWDRLVDLKWSELGELVRAPKMGKTLHRLIHQFPRLELNAHVQPITRALIKIELSITPDFEWNPTVHGYAQGFWILVEDVDEEKILHHEWFLLKQRYAQEEHVVSFTVPILEPLPPQYYIRVVSDRWLHAETTLPVSFRNLILPDRYPPFTELLDLQPLPVKALKDTVAESLYRKKFKQFNAIQTQVFPKLYDTDDNVLIAAPTGSGKTICAEFALLRLFKQGSGHGAGPKAVYVAPKEEICRQTLRDWRNKFGEVLGKRVEELSGEAVADLKVLERSDIVIATPSQWDNLSRRWKQRKAVQNISLFIVDELHLLLGGEAVAATLEIIVSRMRYIAKEFNKPIRIIGLSGCVANAKDMGDWIGTPSDGLFSFHPNVRPLPLEIFVTGYDIHNFSARLLAMSRPVYNAVVGHATDKPAIIFVPSMKQAQLTAIDMQTFAQTQGQKKHRFMHGDPDSEEFQEALGRIRDPTLKATLPNGVGFLHETLSESDSAIVQHLFSSGTISVLVVTAALCWALEAQASLVVLMDTQYYDGREHRYVDYAVGDVLQMMGRANRPMEDAVSKCVILCHNPKKEFFKKFLYEPLPVESHLDHYLHDHLNAEIVTKTIATKEDAVFYISWTLLYRRLRKNPNFYNLQEVSQKHVSHHLSEIVENTINDLEESKCVAVQNDMDLEPLNLGRIASYYYIKYTTIELFASSLTAKTKLKGMIEILSSATEYEDIPVRHREENKLKKMAAHLPQKLEATAKYNDPHTKVNILLQAHFSRLPLSPELRRDLSLVMRDAKRLLQGMVDVISSSGWLKPALAAMELSQMVTRGLWNKDSYLLQIPHFTSEIVQRCEEQEVEGVLDILTLEDDVRDRLLQLPPAKLSAVARFCNSYPNIGLDFSVEEEDDVHAGSPVVISVKLEREVDEDMMADIQENKPEGWWLVVGDPQKNTLLSIKRVNLTHKSEVKLDFLAPEEEGEHKLFLYFMCDSYLGADQEYDFDLQVKEALPEDEEEEE